MSFLRGWSSGATWVGGVLCVAGCSVSPNGSNPQTAEVREPSSSVEDSVAALSPQSESRPGNDSAIPAFEDSFSVVDHEELEAAEGKKSYSIVNESESPREWSVSVLDDWAIAEGPTRGVLVPGASTMVTVTAKREQLAKLEPGTHYAQVRIEEPASGTSHTISAPVVVRPEAPSETLSGEWETEEDPVLIPGEGFTESIDEMDVPQTANSTAAGADAKVIAHWNVVPYQDVRMPLRLGVVAFHINGIDRVDFTVNGGPMRSVDRMSFNPRTETVEYKVTLRPDLFSSSGTVEVRAVAYPTVGIARVLSPLYLNIDRGDLPRAHVYVSPNGNDSAAGTATAPLRSIAYAIRRIANQSGNNRADGGTVYLLPGNHSWGPPATPNPITENRYVVVRPAPGLTRSDVVVTNYSDGGVATKLVHLKDVTIRDVVKNASINGCTIWVEGCEAVGNGQFTSIESNNGHFFKGWDGKYVTDSIIRDNREGSLGNDLVRNTHLHRIGEDAFGHSRLVVNCSVDNIDRGPQTSWHPDAYDLFAGSDSFSENYIIYGLRATNIKAQGILAGFSDRLDNIAIVNTLIHDIPGTYSKSQWSDNIYTNHLLLWNVTTNQPFLWRVDDDHLRNVSVRNSSWKRMSSSPQNGSNPTQHILDAHDVSTNHFEESGSNTITPGIDVTVGNPGYLDPLQGNYTPTANSPLRNRIFQPSVLIDIDMKRREVPGTVGAIE